MLHFPVYCFFSPSSYQQFNKQSIQTHYKTININNQLTRSTINTKPTNTMSSISSTSSLTSTTTTTTPKPFRSIYSKDARGHDLSSSYARKYGTSTLISSTDIPTPTISRLIYAKDARGVDLSASGYEAETYEVTKTMPIVGDDGLPRNPYDHGQRERTLGYWSELRSGASSIRSSSVSLMSSK
jgi:hypothetical protein